MSVEQIQIGSGKIYSKVFDHSIKDKLKDNSKLKELLVEVLKEENRIGYVSGGASLEYKPTFYTAEDDLGYVKRTILTKEETILKTGICTWNGNTLAQMASTARVTEDLTKRILRVGGVSNDDGKEYLIVFHHIDKLIGDSYIFIVGKNSAGFTLKFEKDKETTIDDEIQANILDDDGTQLIYLEEIPDTTLHITSEAGSTTGNTKITVEEPLTEGNSYVYSVKDTIVIPAANEDCSSLTTWDGSSDIVAEKNKQILIVEVDSSKKSIKAGFTSVITKGV